MPAALSTGPVDAATEYTFAFVGEALSPGAKRLLEIGCGSGDLAARLLGAGFDVLALDSDEAAVAAARARGVDARLARWPDFSAGTFDAVLFTRSLHHVEDLEASVAAAIACLAPEGRLIVEDFDAAFADAATFHWFASLLRLLRSAGAPIESSEFLGELASAERPVEAWHESHGHHLHSAAAMERAIASASTRVKTGSSAYFFRYAAAAGEPFEALAQPMLEHEQGLIRQQCIAPLGRRFIATP